MSFVFGYSTKNKLVKKNPGKEEEEEEEEEDEEGDFEEELSENEDVPGEPENEHVGIALLNIFLAFCREN